MSVALEAEEAARKGGLVSAQELLPVYLRPPQAERLRKERMPKLDLLRDITAASGGAAEKGAGEQ